MSVPTPPEGLPYVQWVVYREADGLIVTLARGQQPPDGNSLAPPSGYSVAMLPEGTDFEAVRLFGFIDVDDPAKPIAYDADKLKTDGLTLADIRAGKLDAPLGGSIWDTLPIKKPTRAE